jgi:hypothetical protein
LFNFKPAIACPVGDSSYPLRYGITASAEIEVRKRRLIDVALDPFRQIGGGGVVPAETGTHAEYVGCWHSRYQLGFSMGSSRGKRTGDVKGNITVEEAIETSIVAAAARELGPAAK